MFKKLLLVAVVSAVSAISSANESQADNYVRGHLRSNGSYVNSYHRSNADGNFWNNYSTYPNVNPYTGSVGTRHYPSYSSNRYDYGYSSSYSNFGSYRSSRSSWRW